MICNLKSKLKFSSSNKEFILQVLAKILDSKYMHEINVFVVEVTCEKTYTQSKSMQIGCEIS